MMCDVIWSLYTHQFLLHVVADTGVCAIHVEVWRGAALWDSDSSWTSRYGRKCPQVFWAEQIWKNAQDTFEVFSSTTLCNKKLHLEQGKVRKTRRSLCLSVFVWMCCLCVAAGLTCCVQGAFVNVRRPLVQQTKGLCYVVCRSHNLPGESTRLLQETESVVRAHHFFTDSSQAPEGEEGPNIQ